MFNELEQFLRDLEEPEDELKGFMEALERIPERRVSIVRMPKALPNTSHGDIVWRGAQGNSYKVVYADGYVRERIGSIWIN